MLTHVLQNTLLQAYQPSFSKQLWVLVSSPYVYVYWLMSSLIKGGVDVDYCIILGFSLLPSVPPGTVHSYDILTQLHMVLWLLENTVEG